jgi:CRP-like cAMP-binding protein
MMSGSSWATRLASFAPLSTDDESFLTEMAGGIRHRRADVEFTERAGAADHVLVVVAGLACKSRLLNDGRRQILSFLFPGDMTSPERLLAGQPAQSVSMLIPSEIAILDRGDINDLRARTNIRDAFARYSLVKEAIAAEWQVNVGIRSAQERIAHLLCEMYSRLESIGHARNKVFRLGLTQCQLAECVALSAVHVNRVLMELRRQRILAIGDGMVVIMDYGRLSSIAGFDPSYLQLETPAAAVPVLPVAVHELAYG